MNGYIFIQFKDGTYKLLQDLRLYQSYMDKLNLKLKYKIDYIGFHGLNE